VDAKRKHYGVGRVLQLAYVERARLLWGIVFLAIGSSMLLVYPQIIKHMIDDALKSGEVSKLHKTATSVLVIFTIQAFAGALRYYLFTTAGERIVTGLRERVYRSILHQEIAFFDGRRTGELLSRLAADATVLQNAVSVNISMLMRSLGSAVGGLVLLIYTSPVLALALLAAIPPLALGTARFGRKIRTYSRKVQDALAETSTIAEEGISGIRTVRAFAQEDWEADRYHKALKTSLGLAQDRISYIAWFTGGASLFGYLAIVGVLYYGGYLVLSQKMTVGDLTSFILYTLTVAVSVATLGSLWTDFMAATGAGRRIFEILDRKPEILRGGVTLPMVKGSLQFERVHFSYPSRPDMEVLSEVNFTLEPGEMVALVGASGSGKSTIASLISRFYDPTSGVIRIDGQDLRDLDAGWLRRQVGVVSQDPVLMSTSIAANIAYGHKNATLADLESVAREAHAHGFIQGFPEGYETLVGERGVQLSGGQRQRVAIARAMLKNPKLLILDEATSALDAESEHLVKEALDRLMKGRTTLVIAHRLSTVRNADRILVLDAGKIVQMGTHDSLVAKKDGVYYKLVYLQNFTQSPP
jgi:ABC transporter fused permease/ATP-binding protein